MSEVEERPRLVTGGYGQHRSQRVTTALEWIALTKLQASAIILMSHDSLF